MKKIVMIVAGLMLGTILSYAQDIHESQVPSVVLNNFKKEFPKASDVEWEQKGSGYEVDFEIGFTDHGAWFDATGKLVKHTEKLKARDLPQSIQNSVKQNYAGFRTKDVKKIIAEGETTYELEVEKGKTEWILLFNPSGTELRKVAD